MSRVGAIFNRIFRHDKWAIGVSETLPEDLLTGSLSQPVQWLTGGFGRYMADPFLFRYGERFYLIYELFFYVRGDARIAIAELQKGADGRYCLSGERQIFDEPFHQSYPFIFTYEDVVYCLPEQSESDGLVLYRAKSFPEEWERVKVVIDDFPVVDPTLVHHDDRWWLFATRGEGEQDKTLYLWHGDTPLGPWVPHISSPLKSGLGEVRPAGPVFRHDGRLYRPVQAYDGRYGTGIVLYEINKLSKQTFSETLVGKILPLPERPRGLHHVCMTGGLAVVDGNRYASLPEVALKLFGIIRRRLSKTFR